MQHQTTQNNLIRERTRQKPTMLPISTTDSDSVVQSDWPISPEEGARYVTAVVKGAGPAGLAAAISLIDAGVDPTHLLVVEKRSYRPKGRGRENMVAVRPEGLRRLHEFGCLDYAREHGWITDLNHGQTFNEWNVHLDGGGIFTWPIGRFDSNMQVELTRASDKLDNDGQQDEDEDWVKVEEADADKSRTSKAPESSNIYLAPERINEQVPCCFINLGHLEDALLYAAHRRNIQIRYRSSIELSPEAQTYSDGPRTEKSRYRALLLDDILQSTSRPPRFELSRFDLGCPDLIICASGKNDLTLSKELNFRRLTGLKLEQGNLPLPGQRLLNVGPEHEMESQKYSVFGIRTPQREMGSLDHIVRKQGTGQPEQPVTEIEMRHAMATHCLFQLPRGLETGDLDGYLTQRVNEKLGTHFTNVQQMHDESALVWGNPVKTIIVETATAPQYAFGSNVILIGDAAMSCSPASGLGADIGMTVDSRNVQRLALTLVRDKTNQILEQKQEALEVFNREKAESAVIWSQGSRWFYLTDEEAMDILTRKSQDKNQLSRDW